MKRNILLIGILIIIACICLCTLPQRTFAVYILYGDVNCDREVTDKDRIYIARYLANWDGYTLTTLGRMNADVNRDGVIDKKDRAVLTNYLNKEKGYETLPTEYILYGDVNCDDQVTVADRIYLARYLANYDGYTLTALGEKNADVNLDGVIDKKDRTVLTNYLNVVEGYNILPIPYVVYGDVNCDDQVTVADRIYLARYLANYNGYTLTEQGRKNADVNSDGVINKKDRTILTNYLNQVEAYKTLPIPYVVYGDVNCDDQVTVTDRVYLARYLANYSGYTLTIQGRKNADVNSDGVIDKEDRTVLTNYLNEVEGYETLPIVAWDNILRNATTPHPDQSTTNKDIGIGTDGKLVNLDLWKYINTDNGINLKKEGVNRSYCGNITNGEIEGTVPQYIKIEGTQQFISVTEMYYTFYNCTELITAPEIPANVTNMEGTFFGCTSLTTVPEIPANVTDMIGTFCQCSKLTGTLEINASPTSYQECFSNASTDTSASLVLTGNSTNLTEILNTKSEYSHISILKYNLVFMLDNEVYDTVEYRPGEQTATPTNPPTKTGYIFDGWFESDLEGRHNFGPMINENVTVYGKWIERIYTINYNANGGTGTMEPSTTSYTNWIDLPPCDYTYERHNFLGWDTHSDVTVPFYRSENGSNGRIYGTDLETMLGLTTDSVTLYAIWKEIPSTYRITYMVNETSIGYQDYAPGAAITTIGVPSANVPEGKNFDMWCEEPELIHSVPNPFIMPEEDIIVYARFIDGEPQGNDDYTITYDKNSNTATGTMGPSIFTPDSNNVHFSGCAYQNTGYTFKGWATDVTGTNVIIAYNEWGGTTGQVNGTTLAEKATNKQVTLYAVWEVQKLQVSVSGYTKQQMFDQNNEPMIDDEGNEMYSYSLGIETIEVDYNGTISQTNEILASLDEREGYEFGGWYARITGNLQNTAFDFLTPITQNNISLEARWLFNLTYDLNGGTLQGGGTIPSQNVIEGENITINNIVPELEGATFLGWSSSRNQYSPEWKTLFAPGGTYSTQNMFTNKLYAYWSFDTTTVIYNLNGGTLQGGGTIPNGIATKGTPFTVTSETPVLGEGRTFIGWSTIPPDEDVPWIECKSGETIGNTEGQNVSEITLYAKYAYNTMNVSYNIQPGTVPTAQENLLAPRTVAYNTDLNLPNITPTYTGYTFKGWSVSPSPTGEEETVTETIKIVDVATEEINICAVWEPTWIAESVIDEGNKTITYTIDTNDKLQQLSWYIMQIEENQEYNHIFNISGDLQLGNQITFNENSIVNILGTLDLNNGIDLKGATLSLITTQTTGLNISGFRGIRVDGNSNLIIDGKSLIGNETNSYIDLAINEQNDEVICISEVVATGTDYNNQPFTEYGTSINIERGVATLKNANNTNASSFNVTSNDDLTIESNGKLIIDCNMIVEGSLTIDGELAINENKTVTLINDADIQKNENNVTGLGTLTDNRTVYITYDLRGGTLDLSGYAYTAPKHENFTLPVTPTWAGFDFLGWQVTDGNASEQYDAGEIINFDMIQENQVEINAMWGRRP